MAILKKGVFRIGKRKLIFVYYKEIIIEVNNTLYNFSRYIFYNNIEVRTFCVTESLIHLQNLITIVIVSASV